MEQFKFLRPIVRKRKQEQKRKIIAKKIYKGRANETGAIYHDDTITLWKKSPWKNIKNR